MHILHKIPIITEKLHDGTCRYFCEQCQAVTECIKPAENPGEEVLHTCGFVLHKTAKQIESMVVLDENGLEQNQSRYWCEHCGGWSGWILSAVNPGEARYHGCRANSALAHQQVAAGTIAYPGGIQDRCNSGMLADAEIILLMVRKKESTAPELKALADKALEIFPQMRLLAAQEQLSQESANLETSAPIK